MELRNADILVNKALAGTASKEEAKELYQLLEDAEGQEAVAEALEKSFSSDSYAVNEDIRHREQLKAALLQRIAEERTTAPVHWVHFIRRFRWAAAAVIIVLAGIGGWLLLKDQKVDTPALAKIDIKAPDRNRATVTLGDGQVVYLDQVKDGQLAALGNIKLVKTADGKLVYQTAEGTTINPITNIVSNPRGSRVIDLTLTDGSHVWLNAGSSISYTLPFDKRNVTITGEAYFEVSKDPSHPFTVTKGETSVTVLGTHFNVKAYDNEPDLRVTLLEGSVKVKERNGHQLLKPGEQAVITSHTIQLVTDADTEQAIAWKNGSTSFHDAGIEAVLRELERWYDIKTEIKGQVKSGHYYFDVPRTASLNDVLVSMFSDGGAKYEYDAQSKKLTVLP